ncbi:putative serine/threonine protein phosphatase [Aeromonas phage LAh_9]|uniref:Putative serine/threonine protein phosphatase n=2 Tax=Lahexavirus TaxID=2843411 RepID=A0A514A0U5_9CAUD|nr:NinI-like serine-threonine phosphatase [Aeromonas phage LAh_6]YP_009847556.1 NinI-like serine-threonine phosphatase [Aeromonas phage LAh_9]QDH46512.1 putative serine/threonine protein phosphatase [Aeromonas phage LAh_6]QDH46893.1 putative serine/threonine protein phosphatase [Aeromonas phage LAh_9]
MQHQRPVRSFMIRKTLSVPFKSRVFFVSDLHGEIDNLLIALEKLRFKFGEDYLICGGDLIDRGSDSFKTAAFFLTDKTGSFHTVRGNHDQFAIEAPKSIPIWNMNGGEWATESMSWDQLEGFGESMSKLPYVIEIEFLGKRIGVVHAEVPPEYTTWDSFLKDLEENPVARQRSIWSRDILYGRVSNDFEKTLLGIDHLVHGHTVVDYPTIIGNRHYIDTGHVFGQYLTIAEFIGDDSFVYYRLSYEDKKLSVFEDWDLDIVK